MPPDLESMRGHTVRTRELLAGLEVETPLVQWADHRSPGHDPVGERTAHVRAGCVEREPALLRSENSDPPPSGVDGAALAKRDVAN